MPCCRRTCSFSPGWRTEYFQAQVQQENRRPLVHSGRAGKDPLNEGGRKFLQVTVVSQQLCNKRHLLTAGLVPRTSSFNMAFNALAHGHQPAAALALLRRMLSVGARPNVLTYNAALRALEHAGEPENSSCESTSIAGMSIVSSENAGA